MLFPFATRSSSTEDISRTVSRLRESGPVAFGDSAPVTARVLSVWARPFSDVARVELRSPAGIRRVIAKIPRCKPGKADRRLQQLERELTSARLLASTFAGEAGLSVAEVVAFYPDVPALVWAEVEGATLGTMAARLARGIPSARRLVQLETACRDAGRWLRVLQAATPVEGQQLSLNEMLEYVDVRLKRICELGPGSLGAEWREAVRRLFTEARLTPDDLRLAAVHGDFSLSNIMYDGNRVVAIDLGRFGIGSIYYDVSRLYHQLGLLLHKPWFLPATIARLRRALLAGYDARLRPDQPLFRLYLIQHLLCHWLGGLKDAAAPYHVRRFHQWSGYRHRRELEGLIAQFHDDARRSYV